MNKYSLLFGLMVSLFAYTNSPPQSGRNFDIKRHNINNIELSLSNFGQFAHDDITDEGGCWWPKGSENTYIFGAGIWFGAIDSLGDTLVTIGYGPSGGESEFVPGLINMPITHPDAIIYMYPDEWPPAQNTFPMAPQDALSHQDSWCCFNDADSLYHMPGDTRPIGIEVFQTVYAWALSGLHDVIFLTYEFKNVSGKDLCDCYIGVCVDGDIGNEGGAAGNDFCSVILGEWYVIDGESLWVDNMVYQWQEEDEPGWTHFPGAIGLDLLRTPFDLEWGADKDADGIPDQYEQDSVYYWNNVPDSLWDVDNDLVPDWRDASENPQIGMNSFKIMTRGFEPSRDDERYMTLAGYDYRTGLYDPYDTTQSEPFDVRWLTASGPFSLAPDSSARITLAILFAEWYGLFATSDSACARYDNFVQYIHDRNWFVPCPPCSPQLTCVPGDARITLIWDSSPEFQPDPYYELISDPSKPQTYDPFYREYDFEGYRVWRSVTGTPGNWELIATYDLYNDIVFEEVSYDETDTIRAEDTGLLHSYIDKGLRNGFTYSYAVTSFDWNRMKETDTTYIPIISESERVCATASPRREPANFVPGSCTVEVLRGNPLLIENVSYDITYPLAMTTETISLEFGPIGWAVGNLYDSLGTINGTAVVPCYRAYLKDHHDITIDSVKIETPFGSAVIAHEFMALNGVSLTARFVKDSITAEHALFDSVVVLIGDYPPELVKGVAPLAFSDVISFWAYRGNDYEIHWISTTGGSTANSVVVIDAMSGDTIPYTPYHPDEYVMSDTLANGWGFWSNREVSDTIVLNGPSPQALWNTKWLYICGGMVQIKGGGQLMPPDQLPEAGDIWYAHATDRYVPAPANAAFIVDPTPAYYDTDTEIAELKVKVVPNPYIIHNEWQQSFVSRRLKFINLPANCWIRIFNLNGELVRTIRHTSTLEPGIGEQEVFGSAGGDEWWDLLSANNQLVASGVYIFHIDSDVGEQIGKFVVIR